MTVHPRELTLDDVRGALAGTAAAFRATTDLEPAGGLADKVFPPTYEGGQYATETRIIDGQRIPCVLLDSVQSQANRLEATLLNAHRGGTIRFPLVEIDFTRSSSEDVRVVGKLTALDAPHRLADAWFMASEVDEDGKRRPFRHKDPKKGSRLGQRVEEASVTNATPLFELCPTALIFGMWDSHGARGGSGERFQRALVSEIVGFDVEAGVKPQSRIDRLIPTTADIPIEVTSDGWRLVEKEKGTTADKLSKVGLGNVTPSLADNKTGQLHHGGVTVRAARQLTVLSLPALRRLRFPLAAPPREAEATNLAAEPRSPLLPSPQ